MDIAELVRECVACPLAWRGSGVPGEYVDNRGSFHFGEDKTMYSIYPPPAESTEVMVIGEAPGAVEQAEGRPFVGDSGQLLRSLLADCGLTAYYLTNIVKHRPNAKSGKQQPPDETATRACSPWLRAELASVRPSKIILLGKVAAKWFTPGLMFSSMSDSVGKNPSVVSIVNSEFTHAEYPGVRFLVLYHPAYFLHNRTAPWVNRQVNDWKRAVRNFLGAEIPYYPIEKVECATHR